MDTIPKLFWKRLEKMSLDEFEIPQWNISLNDSGIQVTLFWAEKCSPVMDTTQDFDNKLVDKVAESILNQNEEPVVKSDLSSEICALNGIEPINSSLIQVANQIQQATADPPITSTYKLIQPRVENINSGNSGSPTTVSLDASQLNTITTIYSGINGKDLFNNIAIQPKPASLISSDSSFSNSSRFESKKRKVLMLESSTTPPKSKKSSTCDICGSTFTYRQNMLRHRKTHDMTKSVFKCELCGKTFARNENLQKHILSNCDSSLELSGNQPSYTLVTPKTPPSGGKNGDQNDGIVGITYNVAVKLEPKNDQSSNKDANTENKM